MDDEPLDATVGIGAVGHNNSALNNSISRMEKNSMTSNGSSLSSKFGSNRNPNKFSSNDRNGANSISGQQSNAQLSPNSLATAAAALATAAAANGMSVNQLLSQVLIDCLTRV